MAGYVKVNKVTSYIKGYAQRSIDLGGFDLVDDILAICENIEKMPVADVVKVNHGRWIVRESPTSLDVKCSICNASYYVHKKGQYHIEQSKYCPNCGAKMDGSAVDEK